MQARPMSRGLGPGGPGGPMQSTMRMGTAMGGGATGGGAPPGTGMRMGTRQGTGMRGTAMQQTLGVGAHTEVRVADRPMTMHGLSGMKTGSLGPKRQVYDKSYYVGELRKRCQELSEEVEKMAREAEEIRSDNQMYQSLEKRYDQLVKTVRSLEGDLADHNLATDKQRTDTQPEEVHHMYMIMKQQNDQQRQEVDQIFLEKKNHEEQIQKLHQEILALARAAEERLNELHPDQHREYEMLREENGKLGMELSERREENDQITDRLRTLEGHLRSDVFRLRCQQLQEAKKEIAGRLETLEVEARQCSLSVPEQRELLLAKVKNDNADIVSAEKRNQELKLEKEKLKSHIQEVATAATGDSADTQSDQRKYEKLYSQDQEMTQFIDSFDKLKKDEEDKMVEKQASIKRLLENISATLALTVAPQSRMKEVQDELQFKNRTLANAENTRSRVEEDLRERQKELDRIAGLDAKFSREMHTVETNMKAYTDEIANKFDKVEEMRVLGQERLQQLAARRAELEERKAALEQQVIQLKLKVDAKRNQLADDELAQGLEAQEAEIRRFGQTLYTLSSFIRSKNAESNYEPELMSVLDLSSQLNKIHCERRHMPTC